MRRVALGNIPRKWLRRIANLAVISCASTLLLGLALLGALRTQPVRTFAIAQVNRALGGLFLGRLHIESVAWLGLTGVGGVNATMFDVDRHAVLTVRNASARIAVVPLLWSVIAHPRGPLSVDLSRATIAHAQVWLIDAGHGVPSLAFAFYPPHPNPSASSAVIPTIRLRSIAIDHVWVHGQLASAPAIDADIGNTSAILDIVAARLRLQLDGASVHARGLPNGVTLVGKVGGVMDLPIADPPHLDNTSASLPPRSGPIVHAWYSGQFAGSPITTTFDWLNDKLSASLDSPRVDPASVTRLAAGFILKHPLILHATAQGTLADIRFEATASVDKPQTAAPTSELNSTTFVVVGRASLDEDTAIDAEIRAQNVSLADLHATAPESRLNGVAHAQFTHTHRGTVTGRYDLTTWPGLISDTRIPAFDLEGSVKDEPAVAFTTDGHAQILEPGATTTIQYAVKLVPKSNESIVSIESFTELAAPIRLRSLANGLRAHGNVEVSAHYWPGNGHWRAQSNARLRDVQLDRVGAGRIDVLAEVASGQLAPSGSIHVRARDIKAAGQTFRNLDLVVDGTLTQSRLAAHVERSDAQQLDLTTELGLRPIVRAHDTRIIIPSSKGEVAVSIDDIRLNGGVTRVNGLHLQGAGTADASLTIGRELQQLSLSAESFDWAQVARLLGFPLPIQSGNATLVARYENNKGAVEGFIRGRTVRVDIGPYHNASANVDLMLSSGLIDGTLASHLGPGSSLNISVHSLPLSRIDDPDLVLESSDFSLSMRGAMNLAPLHSWLHTLDVPLERTSGTVLFELTAQGPSRGHQSPELLARVQTSSLQLTGLSDAQTPIENAALAKSAKPWSLQGVDGKFTLSVSGDHPTVFSSAELYDQRGALFNVRASAQLPTSIGRTLQLSRSEALAIPLVASFHMPRRALQQLPAIANAQGLRGIAWLDGALDGALDNPRFVIDGAVERLTASIGHRPSKQVPALDVSVHANGSRHAGAVRVDAKKQNLTVGSLQTNWDGDITRLASASLDAPSPLHGELVARLNRFEIERLPIFRNNQVSGLVTGSVSLRDWGRDAHFVTELLAEEVQIGRVIVDRGELAANNADGRLVAKVRLSGRSSGTLDADMTTKVTWGTRLVPDVDPGFFGELRARDLQIGMLSPFVSGSVNELSGSIDAKLSVSLAGGMPQVEGQAMLSQGVIQIPSIGQRFDSIRALATVHDGTLSIDNMQARGLTGRVTGRANFLLDGLSMTKGDVHFAIARNEQIPITIEGQAIGDAWGRVEVTLSHLAGESATNIRVDVPELHFDLPDLDPRELQSLELAEHVRIGVHRGDGQFIYLPVQPLASREQSEGEALMVSVHLGDSVWIQKGPGIKVHLKGDLLARMAEETTLEGRLDLSGGTLDVSGKTFEVERGVVIFDGGDTGNPSINARARWDSPTGYSVYAEYAGTVNDGKLTLRSEPALSSDRVVTLLMFGTPDGPFGADNAQSKGGETTSAAVGFAGETAAKGLNKAISGVTKLDVSARLDTSTGTARPELDVQLTRRVTARMTRAIGEPAVGQSPDRTFLTLEMRLLRAWSLSAVVGDHGGSGLDLLWRRRY